MLNIYICYHGIGPKADSVIESQCPSVRLSVSALAKHPLPKVNQILVKGRIANFGLRETLLCFLLLASIIFWTFIFFGVLGTTLLWNTLLWNTLPPPPTPAPTSPPNTKQKTEISLWYQCYSPHWSRDSVSRMQDLFLTFVIFLQTVTLRLKKFKQCIKNW